MTSSWFFLSTLNYDARSTTHQILHKIEASSINKMGHNTLRTRNQARQMLSDCDIKHCIGLNLGTFDTPKGSGEWWGFFRSLRKTAKKKKTVSNAMSVCPFVWNNYASTGWIFMKFDIWEISKICLKNSSFH